MSKLYFRYGAMGSSKTANALMTVYNYEERGKHPLLLKPKIESRDGTNIIRSRIGISRECDLVEDLDWEDAARFEDVDAIIVDEVQFLEEKYIDAFGNVVDKLDIPVICYGLRTDFQGHLFPASKRLMEIADAIEEIPTICWCGHKAQFNARVVDGKVIKEGDTIVLGGNDLYVPLCRKHFNNLLLKKD